MKERLESLLSKKFLLALGAFAYAAIYGDTELMKYVVLVYSGVEGGQNLVGILKNGKPSGDTAALLKNLLEKQAEVVNPCTEEDEATVDDSGANEATPAIETEPAPEVEQPAEPTIKPINIELVLETIKKRLVADMVPINPEIVSMKFHEWVLRNWDNIPGFDQARVLEYAISLAREHYRIVVGDTAPMTGESMVNYNQFLASIQPQLTEKYGCGKYPAERVRVAVMDLRGLYNFKGEVSL